MYQGYKVIDADAHFYEPWDIWDRYVEAEHYERRPRVVEYFGRARMEFAVDGVFFTDSQKKPGTDLRYREHAQKYGHAYDSWWNLESRLKDMNSNGWDVQVSLPTNGGVGGSISHKDAKLGAALCRAYNNWAHDFTSASGGRVKFAAVVPGGDIEETVIEARRAVDKLGAVTFMAPHPPTGKEWDQPDYDPLWELAVELDFPLSLHGTGSRSGDPPLTTRYENRGSFYEAIYHAMDFPLENMVALAHFVFSGLLDRYPTLKISVLESNCGWMPFWLNRLEKCSEGRQSLTFYTDPLKASPEEYFRRQCFVACDVDEPGISFAIDQLGDERIVFNTDYPHFDAPNPPDVLPTMLAQPISQESMRKILWGNSVGLYGSRLLAGVQLEG